MNKPYINKLHFILEGLGYICNFLSVAYAIVKINTIDGEIPTHYNAYGEVDGYGSPTTLLILPICMLVTCAIVSLCLHLVPVSMWNTGFKLTPGRENIVLADFGYMMSAMVLEMGAYSLVTVYFFDKGAGGVMISSLVLVAISFLTVAVFFIKAYRDNKE